MSIRTDAVDAYFDQLRPQRAPIMAEIEALDAGSPVTLERGPGRIAQARDFLDRGGVGDRVQIVEGDASDPDAEGHWSEEQLDTQRAFNAALVASDDWRASVLPVGDGVLVASRT